MQLLDAAAHRRQRDLRRACVNGIFQQFLRHGGGPFDDLARRDQLCGMLVQYTNFRHGFHLPLVFVQCIFQLVQEVQRLQRGQCLNVYIVELFDDLAGYAGVVVSLDGVKIELHRVIASRCAGLQLAQHGVGALCHAAGQTRELRDLDAVAVVGGALPQCGAKT